MIIIFPLGLLCAKLLSFFIFSVHTDFSWVIFPFVCLLHGQSCCVSQVSILHFCFIYLIKHFQLELYSCKIGSCSTHLCSLLVNTSYLESIGCFNKVHFTVQNNKVKYLLNCVHTSKITNEHTFYVGKCGFAWA